MAESKRIRINPGERGLREIGIGILGYGFMGKMHSTAYSKMPFQTGRAPAKPKLVAMCGRNEQKVREVALRYGYQGFYTRWQDLVEDPDIEIFDNSGPDFLHCDPCIAAAQAKKHVICEKPLAVTADEAKRMALAARKAGVKSLCGFNYRFIPAVRLARQLIEQGVIGRISSFNGRYLQEWGHDPATPVENVWYTAGKRTGVMLGIGSHLLDLARHLMGEVTSVTGAVRTFNNRRKNLAGVEEEITADELDAGILEFESGALGIIESSAISTGRKNFLTFEISGSKGSLVFNLEDLNHLKVYVEGGADKDIPGFRDVSVTEFHHPFAQMAWAPGHNVGWETAIIYELFHFVDALVNDRPVGPDAATFEDGYKVQYLMEALKESSRVGKKLKVEYGL
jgi:predicted dehydrogenase